MGFSRKSKNGTRFYRIQLAKKILRERPKGLQGNLKKLTAISAFLASSCGIHTTRCGDWHHLSDTCRLAISTILANSCSICTALRLRSTLFTFLILTICTICTVCALSSTLYSENTRASEKQKKDGKNL